ncbi:hypothetical protein H4582DRAFT_1893767 [Lactarius indigo]|nr:hypothetical protein H4582DRAFT_1893767 [Lactarius indigo]
MPTPGETDITSSETSALLERLVDVFFEAGRPDKVFHYKLKHIHSLGPISRAEQLVELNAIATTLSKGTIFDFEKLFKLDAFLAAQVHPLFALLHTFLSGGTNYLHAWPAAHVCRHHWVILHVTTTKWSAGSSMENDLRADSVTNQKLPAPAR